MRVARVALHRPIERHSSTEASMTGLSQCERPKICFGAQRLDRLDNVGAPVFVAIHEQEPKKHPFPGLSHSLNVVVAPRYVARVQPGSGGLKE